MNQTTTIIQYQIRRKFFLASYPTNYQMGDQIVGKQDTEMRYQSQEYNENKLLV